MAKLQINLSGKGGLAPKFAGDNDRTISQPNLRYIGNNTQMAEGIYNPFRRYGYISPANATFGAVTLSTIPTLVLTSSIYDAVNNDFYFAERGQRIYVGDGLDDTTLTETHDLGSTGTPRIMDLEIYQIDGVRKFFYVYEKAGNLEVGEADITTPPISSENDNWLTANVSGYFTNTLVNNAFMRVADNGFAYLFADNTIHKIDGTTNGGANGTITANVITFPAYFQITDAIDYRGKMYVVIRQDTKDSIGNETAYVHEGNIGVYIWDKKTSVVSMDDYLPITGIKEVRKIYVSPQGDLRLHCINSERIVEIRKFSGANFISDTQLGVGSFVPHHDSLTTAIGMTVWLGYDGKIYAHGKISPQEKESIYIIGNISDTIASSGDRVGAILFGGGNADSSTSGFKNTKNGLYLSYITGTTVTVKEWDLYGTGADGVNSTPNQGDIYTLVKYLPQMSTVNYIDIFMMPSTYTGTTVQSTIKIYFNQSSTAWAGKTIDRNTISRGYKRIEINKQYINSIQLEIEYPDNIGIGTIDFAPSVAVVDYTPTRTKG